jgi:NADH-quinone oxidoreductase subunit N
VITAAASVKGPYIDWAALSPVVALAAGIVVVLMAGLLRSRFWRTVVVPLLAVATLGVTIGLAVWQWGDNTAVVSGALAIDNLSLGLTVLFCAGAILAVGLGSGGLAAEDAGHGEYHALLLASVLGMVTLAGAQDLITLFVGFELLSIPLYVLCASELRRATSLESGLKYLIIGSFGSATLLYGLAMLYGATGQTGFGAIARSLNDTGFNHDVLLLTGIGLVMTGLAFKASVAPFHQWTPDVYEGAPTPITGFMAVATKAAAFGVILRLFDVALIPAATTWAPVLAVLAAITIVVGNVGALGQSSLKRLLAYSSVAQAGYLLAGVVVTTTLGVAAAAFYLAVYLLMNLAAFAVIAVRERETDRGDDISSLYGVAAERPVLAAVMSIAMLALAGMPSTAGFFGKLYLIQAAVDNGYGWLSVFIVLGAAVSLVYYLRVIAALWTAPREDPTVAVARVTPSGRAVMAGGSSEADAGALVHQPADRRSVAPGGPGGEDGNVVPRSHPLGVAVGVLCAAGTIFFGVYPQPLLDVAQQAGRALGSLL